MAQNKEEKTDTTKKSVMVFAMFYILGTVSHVPLSFYITANDYWMYKFRNPDESTTNMSDTTVKTDLQTKFTSYYTVVANIGVVVGLSLALLLIKKDLVQATILTIFNTLLTLFIITIILAWVDTDAWQTTFFIITLIIAIFLNVTGMCLLLSVLFLASKFPMIYTGAVLSGQSICGIMSVTIQILTLATGTSSIISASLYFIVGTIFLIVVEALLVTVLMRHEYYKKEMNKKIELEPITFDLRTILGIVKKISPFAFSMIITSASVVAVHPGVTTLVESESKGYGRWGDTFFVPVCTFLTFCTMDFIGRECAKFNWVKNQYIIMVSAILRLSLIPVILFCNVQPRRHLEVVFNHDWQFVLCFGAFAISGGFMSNLSVLTIPTICRPEEMNIATLIVLLATVLSLAVCGILSPILVALV